MSDQPPASPLDSANAQFRAIYAETRNEAGHEIPVLVVMPAELALHCHGERTSYPYSRPSFGVARSASHIAVALFALSLRPEVTLAALGSLRGKAESACKELCEMKTTIEKEACSLLEVAIAFSDALSSGRGGRTLTEEFGARVGPMILGLTELATREQVAALHQAFERVLQGLTKDSRKALEVVVIGDHQARVRSLGMQYFRRRFREPAAGDERVTYGENLSTESEALALVGTRRLDKVIAKAFFGDEQRLQRDVLGDAALRCLDEMTLESIA